MRRIIHYHVFDSSVIIEIIDIHGIAIFKPENNPPVA
jgi:hypothetical protein